MKNCEECEEIVKCEICGKKLCTCSCQTCNKCIGQAASKEIKECGCDERIHNCLNLINNYNYPGSIGIYKGENTMSTRSGDIVLVNNIDTTSGDCTIETPLSQERIDENRSQGNLITTMGTCVCVPLGLIEFTEHKYLDKIK